MCVCMQGVFYMEYVSINTKVIVNKTKDKSIDPGSGWS